MRIHTHLCLGMIESAALKAGVSFGKLVAHGSRTREHAFEVQLLGTSTRRPNSGSRGVGRDDYAATWDEWGIFLADLFEADPDIVCQPYNGAADFYYKTDGRYESLRKEDQHRNHKWEFAAPGAQECNCGAVRRWQ